MCWEEADPGTAEREGKGEGACGSYSLLLDLHWLEDTGEHENTSWEASLYSISSIGLLAIAKIALVHSLHAAFLW